MLVLLDDCMSGLLVLVVILVVIVFVSLEGVSSVEIVNIGHFDVFVSSGKIRTRDHVSRLLILLICGGLTIKAYM